LTVLRGLGETRQTLALPATGPLTSMVPPAVSVVQASTARELAALVDTVRPHLIHTWFDDSLLMASPVAAHFGIPLVHRLCNLPSLYKAYEPGGIGHDEMTARALRAATRVIALSSEAADDAVAFYGIVRPIVIHNGYPLAGERGGGAARVEKEPGRLVLLNVGRLAPQKGQTYLIEALGRLAAKHPHVELWLAGVGPLEPALRAQAAAAGVSAHVRFLGFEEDVTALHAAADIFVFPSLFEGFPNALGEAFLAGLPVIASDLSVVRHDILGGEPSAVLTPVGDAGALAAAIDRLVSDAPARAALAARARLVGERFPVARMLDEYRGVYGEIVANERLVAA
jgi:glycosyltransferase involved in cell wall biosynthesis